MTWNATFPDGTISVKANKTIGQQNTTYIETNMGDSAEGSNAVTTRDHYWNVDADLDGRHRFIQSKGFEVGGSAADPVLGTSMDGVLYLREVNSTIGRNEWFHRNTNGIYQVTPSFLSGTASITSTSTYATVVAVPADVYGEIFMYTTALGKLSVQTGYFRSNGTTVESWSIAAAIQGTSDQSPPLKLGNGSEASGLNIRARREEAASATWNYRITYRAL